jgi:hydroxyethylthiazole kinase-like uncharacterized protein yjeF
MVDLTADLLRKMPLPDPENGDKQARGNVLIVAGAREVPGAALLAGTGALRAGAGRLQIATSESNASALAVAIPEALVRGLPNALAGTFGPQAITSLEPLLEQADSILIGPGLNDSEELAELVAKVLEVARPELTLIFDAGAIKRLRTVKELLNLYAGKIIITPHAGEMAGLMAIERNEVEKDPTLVAESAAKVLKSVVALKGARTFIASPVDRTVVCRAGNVGLATSGSGDVLAGVISGLAARGAGPFEAACWGVYLHAEAGDRLAERVGPLGFLAREILDEIPRLMAQFSHQT